MTTEILGITVQEWLYRLGTVVVILVGLYLFRLLLARLVRPRLARLAGRTNTNVDDLILNSIVVPFRLVLLAIGIAVVASAFSADGQMPPFVVHLTRTLIIIAIFLFVSRLVGVITRSARLLLTLTGLSIEERLLPFIRNGLRILVGILAFVVILQEWQFDVGGLIAGLGLSGLGVALASQDLAANLFGFTTIIGDEPLREGEYIVTVDVAGIVEHIGFRSTRIRQLDQSLVTVPNGKLSNSVVTNWSRLVKRRLDMTIGVTYGTSSAQMRALLQRLDDVLKAREAVDPTSVMVFFSNFGNSSLDVRLIAFIGIADWFAFNVEVQEISLEIMDVVEEMGLSFAFPSRSLYVEQLPPPSEPVPPNAAPTPEAAPPPETP
jgi:MscS family membrane protein